jgi:hypothetical protein
MNATRGRQGGWVGMIVLLLALVIVAYLAKDALRKYGLMPTGETAAIKAGTPGERSGSAAAGATERMDPTGSAPAPANAIDKARALEGTLNKAAQERGGAQ